MLTFLGAFGVHTALALFALLVFYGWGRLAMRTLALELGSFFEDAFFAFTLGMGACIVIIGVLSFLGLVYPPTLALLLVGLVGLRPSRLPVPAAQLAVMVGVLLPTIVFTLYPPTLWDDISYHLPVADIILQQHRLIFYSDLRVPTYPLNGELLFVPGLLVSPMAAQLVPWLCMVVLAVGCYAEVERRVPGKWNGCLGLAMLGSNILFLLIAFVGYIDIQLALFVTASMIAFARFLETNESKWILMTGALLGIAAGVKFPALFFIALVMGYMAFTRRWKALFLMSGVFVLLSAPWYLRSLYHMHNPLWPFLTGIFSQGDFWNAADFKGQADDFKHVGTPKTLANFLSLPLYFLSPQEGPPYCVPLWIWPGLFAFFIGRLKEEIDRFYLFAVFGYTAFWFVTVNVIRYYLPIVPLLAIVSTIGYLRLVELILRNAQVRQAVIVIAIFLGFLSTGLVLHRHQANLGPVPVTEQQRTDYLRIRLPIYDAVRYSSSLNGRVYGLLTENMFFYGRGNVIGDHFGRNRYSDLLAVARDPKAMHTHLVKLGFCYVLVNIARAENSFKSYPELVNSLKSLDRSKRFRVVYRDAHGVVYQLNPQPGGLNIAPERKVLAP